MKKTIFKKIYLKQNKKIPQTMYGINRVDDRYTKSLKDSCCSGSDYARTKTTDPLKAQEGFEELKRTPYSFAW